MTETQNNPPMFAAEIDNPQNNGSSQSSKSWKAVTASVRGPSHERGGQPCQDSSAWLVKKNRLVAVISDGAGSAPLAREGSRHIAIGLVEALSQIEQSHDWFLTLSACIEKIRNQICCKSLHENTQDKNQTDDQANTPAPELTEKEKTAILRQYHATVVGVMADKNGGFIFHIGDGAAAAWHTDTPEQIRISKPENGQYANETFFFTVPDWKQHLRITRFGPCDRFLLTSDGVTPFAFARDFSHFEKRFILPLDEFLTKTPEIQAGEALAHTLNDPKARKISQDDKTLLWAGLVEKQHTKSNNSASSHETSQPDTPDSSQNIAMKEQAQDG